MVNLGSVQLQIMKVLWDEKSASARRITEVLGQKSNIAHSTVQTLIRQLERKKVVDHELDDRTFMYRALIPESSVTQSVAQDVLERVFRGSISGLVAHLLESQPVSEDEIRRLHSLIEEKAKENQL